MKVKTARRISTTLYNVSFYGTAALIIGGYIVAKFNKE